MNKLEDFMKNIVFIVVISMVIIANLFTGCETLNMELANDQTIDMDSVETLVISYSSDDVVLLESNDSNLILKEYMTSNRSNYFANIDNSQGTLTISNGKRQRLSFVDTMIEIYIPKTFTDKLSVNLNSGNLTVKYNMNNETINLFASSGNIDANSISSENVTVEASSGNVTVGNFTGKGTIKAASGNIKLTLNNIAGDISLTTNSGNIDLLTRENISFILDAEVRSGNITGPGFRWQGYTKAQRNIGSDPIYTVFAMARSGNINIKQ
jgi:DUF4097 and DUF4098 domain-containing protein YvlB